MKLFERYEKKNQETAIIETALKLFKRNGIAGVSMDDISSMMKISKKTIYKNFENKESLVEKVVDHLFEKHFRFIESEEINKLNVSEKILGIYNYGINEMLQFRPIFYQDLVKYHTQAFYKYQIHRKKLVFDYIKKILEEAQIEGAIDKSININLFCELNLLELNKILSQSQLAKHFSPEIIANHTVGLSLRGLLKKNL